MENGVFGGANLAIECAPEGLAVWSSVGAWNAGVEFALVGDRVGVD